MMNEDEDDAFIRELTELEPCPFCGMSFVYSEISDEGVEVRHYNKDCHIEQFVGWFKTREEAVRKLNSRPLEDALRAQLVEKDKEIARLTCLLKDNDIPTGDNEFLRGA